jgi:hypothetical protein
MIFWKFSKGLFGTFFDRDFFEKFLNDPLIHFLIETFEKFPSVGLVRFDRNFWGLFGTFFDRDFWRIFLRIRLNILAYGFNLIS